MKNKSDLKAKIKTMLTNLKISGWNVRFVTCDDAGKNVTMKNDPEIKSFSVKFEFSVPIPLQRNGKGEKIPNTLFKNPVNVKWSWF
jgi:hypothetical protein